MTIHGLRSWWDCARIRCLGPPGKRTRRAQTPAGASETSRWCDAPVLIAALALYRRAQRLDAVPRSALQHIGTLSLGGRLMPEPLGKAWLVSRLKALFPTRRLELPRSHPEAEAMRNELMDYEITVSQDANDRYDAFRTGAHDDLVTVVGLAVQDSSRLDMLHTTDVLTEMYADMRGW